MAVSVVVSPEQMTTELTEIVGAGLTVTVPFAFAGKQDPNV